MIKKVYKYNELDGSFDCERDFVEFLSKLRALGTNFHIIIFRIRLYASHSTANICAT